MSPLDPTLSSPFRIEWLEPVEPADEDDFGRAVAEKAEAILQAATFMASQQRPGDRTDMEIRVWVQGARASACVSITWEPGAQAFGFYVLDESLRDRMAVLVFDALPCMSADETLGQAGEILAAALESTKSIRIPVLEGPAVDPGIDP